MPGMPQPAKAIGRAGAGDLRGRAGRRPQRRGGAAGQQRGQSDHAAALRCNRAAHAVRRRTARRGRDATIRTWIDQGARPTPTAPPAKAKWEAPLSLERPGFPPRFWKDWNQPLDHFMAAYLKEQGGRAQARIGRGVCEPRLSRHLGPAAGARRVAGVPEGSGSRTSGTARRAAAGGRPKIRRELDLLLERSAAQRRRRELLLGNGVTAKASPSGCCMRWNRTCPTTSWSPSCSIRPRPTIPRVPDGGQLARHGKRQPDSGDAGGAEYGADLSWASI